MFSEIQVCRVPLRGDIARALTGKCQKSVRATGMMVVLLTPRAEGLRAQETRASAPQPHGSSSLQARGSNIPRSAAIPRTDRGEYAARHKPP